MTALVGNQGLGRVGKLTPNVGVLIALTGQKGIGKAGQLGFSSAAVPSVSGVPIANARLILSASGFPVGALTYETSKTIDVGSVIRQLPVATTVAVEGTPVALVISSGYPNPSNTPATGLRLPNLPNKILPPDNALVNAKGTISPNWWRFLLNVSNQAMGTNQTQAATVTVGASPYIFTTPVQGTLLVAGGPVTLIEYSKDQITWYPLGVTQGQVQMVPNDSVRVTYMNAPTLTFFPR